ncbi:GTP-binding protein TrmE [Isosphaera pallida ATCC 43644]|uniref:tRNA modification GTPase MnmE n=1 Tax=Isosphaera pallida (strain ATCC 43644 / DSM 9630 / IS1B) TaxID=575540 RepID=E8R416_ISOPI|nr:GTPase [Isosphaera pallida]ADV61603.1 GTP-binding protein TrmE [Isosphaera pallida ATCC 43644]
MSAREVGDFEDTIAAISSPHGPAARGILRISGPRAWSVALARFTPRAHVGDPVGATSTVSWTPGVHAGWFHALEIATPIPAELTLGRAPRTFTGQDLAEWHLPGSEPLLNAALETILTENVDVSSELVAPNLGEFSNPEATQAFSTRRGRVRSARPGEFTLRAYLAGKLDLIQAEAVWEVVHATTPQRLRAALDRLAGGLGSPLLETRSDLLDVLAIIEANLDFVDEADVDPVELAQLVAVLDHQRERLRQLLERGRARERDGRVPRVVIVGAPNAGKSCLFNALLGSDRALVSPVVGTTRDYLAEPLQLPADESDPASEPFVVELIDTAGDERLETLWDTDPPPHSEPRPAPLESIRHQADAARRSQLEAADLVLRCWAHDAPPTPELIAWRPGPGQDLLEVGTKGDLDQRHCASEHRHHQVLDVITSTATGEGLKELRRLIVRRLADRIQDEDEEAALPARVTEGLRNALAALDRAAWAVAQGRDLELAAVDLAQAINDLGAVVGIEVEDDILDRIFQRFCIGK